MCLKRGWVRILFVSLLVGIGGCGGHLREVPSSETAALVTGATDFARTLRPMIVESLESDPTLPGTAVVEEQVTASDQTVVFNRVIALPDGTSQKRPLFLVWGRTAFDSPIVNAFYSHERWDSRNEREGQRERLNVRQDSERQHWYIPLASLMQGLVENIDSSEIHWICLELQLESGARAYLNVGVRFQAPISSVRVEQVDRTQRDRQASAWFKTAGSEGWTILEERYSNPTSRELSLWFRNLSTSARAALRVDTVQYRHVPGTDQVLGEPRSFVSHGAMNVLEIQVTHPNGSMEIFEMKEDRGKKVRLNPLETLTVKWVVKASPGVMRCPLPQPALKEFKWISFFEKNPDGKGKMGQKCYAADPRCWKRFREAAKNPKQASREQNWTLAGGSFEADLDREVWLGSVAAEADPAELLKPAPVRPWFRLVGERKVIQESAGAKVEDLKIPFPCQGVF